MPLTKIELRLIALVVIGAGFNALPIDAWDPMPWDIMLSITMPL